MAAKKAKREQAQNQKAREEAMKKCKRQARQTREPDRRSKAKMFTDLEKDLEEAIRREQERLFKTREQRQKAREQRQKEQEQRQKDEDLRACPILTAERKPKLADRLQRWQISCGMVVNPSGKGQKWMSFLKKAGDIRRMYRRIAVIYPDIVMNDKLKAQMSLITGDDSPNTRAVKKVWKLLALQIAPDRLVGKSTEQIALGTSIYKVLVEALANFKEYAKMAKESRWKGWRHEL